MSGVTPLLDTLLATRLAQRVDLVPLKGELEIAGPGAVTNVEKISNDVRLPSREALQRQLAGVLSDKGDSGQGRASNRAGGAVTLSAAARVVSTILNLPTDSVPAVRGTVPLAPQVATLAVPVLAATLARTVAGSGLFYESHLQQYAAGTRTLAQMVQEPQAGLPSAARRVMIAPATPMAIPDLVAGGAGGLPTPAIPAASAVALAGAVAALPGVDTQALATPPQDAAPAAPLATSDGSAEPGANPDRAPQPPVIRIVHPETAELAAAYRRVGTPASGLGALHGAGGQEFTDAEPGTGSVPAQERGEPVAAIHPEAVALVRQQLEMLASPVFRWSGEGWPGMAMDWEIHEERGEPQEQEEGRGDDGDLPAASTWTTRVTMQLPRLGAVDLRLSLADTALRLHLVASEKATVALLDAGRDVLPQRFGALGLQLTELQIGALTEDTSASATPGQEDAA
ncbi:MAG: flagellar hook-length control protein FliK [Polaromonas sp.]|uniref:flagellar hook-length control protein FliK n=1 Tax=Polaromonas sp. TaxID=1869339 RepID=UPI002487A515|nr:flagellar hook-length control protein FliK [Polaromonas sp.]MDI1268720.1 flagellar hook-length control protein FliK [Polaromonas sp.]